MKKKKSEALCRLIPRELSSWLHPSSSSSSLIPRERRMQDRSSERERERQMERLLLQCEAEDWDAMLQTEACLTADNNNTQRLNVVKNRVEKNIRNRSASNSTSLMPWTWFWWCISLYRLIMIHSSIKNSSSQFSIDIVAHKLIIHLRKRASLEYECLSVFISSSVPAADRVLIRNSSSSLSLIFMSFTEQPYSAPSITHLKMMKTGMRRE